METGGLTNGIALWKGARVFSKARKAGSEKKLNIFRKVGKEPIRIMDLKAMPQAATSQNRPSPGSVKPEMNSSSLRKTTGDAGRCCLPRPLPSSACALLTTWGRGGRRGASSPVSSTASYSASVSPAVGVGSIAAEAQAFGREFTGGFDKGSAQTLLPLINGSKNISKPFSSLPAESSNYGKQTVAGFASGQNASATGTGGFLQAKVNAPYQTTVKTSSSWGANTVKNFATGQNATPTGTSQYVDKNINKPFLDSKQSAAGWGSGMVGHFISGMNGKGSEVSQAAKTWRKS